MKLMRKIVLISIILVAAYTTSVSAEVGDLLISTGYKSLDVGESWDLEEGYMLTIQQIDIEGTKIWLVLSKHDREEDSEVLSNGETYVYEKEIGSEEYTILRATVGKIDRKSLTVRLDSVRQYSDGGVAVAPTTTVGTEVGNVLVEQDKLTLSTGVSFDLEDEYVLTAAQIDLEGQKVWLILSRYGSEIDDDVLSVGDTYSYTKNIDDIEYLLVKTKVDAVFRGTDGTIVQLVSTYQYREGAVAVAEVTPTPTPVRTPATTQRTGTDWPMFRHDPAHSGVAGEGVAPPLTLLWKYKTGDGIRSSPAVSGGIVYIGSKDQYVYALNADTGKLKWKYKTGDEIQSSPAVSGGIVYIGVKAQHIAYTFSSAR
jgi:uncharacterized membrane protein